MTESIASSESRPDAEQNNPTRFAHGKLSAYDPNPPPQRGEGEMEKSSPLAGEDLGGGYLTERTLP
jgi:hypothetical protein